MNRTEGLVIIAAIGAVATVCIVRIVQKEETKRHLSDNRCRWTRLLSGKTLSMFKHLVD